MVRKFAFKNWPNKMAYEDVFCNFNRKMSQSLRMCFKITIFNNSVTFLRKILPINIVWELKSPCHSLTTSLELFEMVYIPPRNVLHLRALKCEEPEKPLLFLKAGVYKVANSRDPVSVINWVPIYKRLKKLELPLFFPKLQKKWLNA